MCVCVEGWGGGEQLGENPDSSAFLILVPHFILPEDTRKNDFLSMHKCYTLFLVCLAWPKNVSLFAL